MYMVNKSKLNLDDLEKRLDDILDSETEESLTKWLLEKRRKYV